MVWAGSNSDRTGERRMHCAIASVLASAGLGMTGFLLHSPVLALVALSVAVIGILAALPVFWAIPAAFASPYLMGWLRESTGNLAVSLYAVAAIQLMGAVLLIAFVRMKTEKLAVAH